MNSSDAEWKKVNVYRISLKQDRAGFTVERHQEKKSYGRDNRC